MADKYCLRRRHVGKDIAKEEKKTANLSDYVRLALGSAGAAKPRCLTEAAHYATGEAVRNLRKKINQSRIRTAFGLSAESHMRTTKRV